MIAISIKKEDDGNLGAYADGAYLFEFRYIQSLGMWKFWISGVLSKKWEGRAFPWTLFIDLCRATYCLKYDKPIWSRDYYAVKSGKSYVE